MLPGRPVDPDVAPVCGLPDNSASLLAATQSGLLTKRSKVATCLLKGGTDLERTLEAPSGDFYIALPRCDEPQTVEGFNMARLLLEHIFKLDSGVVPTVGGALV